MHLSYGSSRDRPLIDRELYLGKAWAGTTAEHERRCTEQGIPSDRAGAVVTKPELARRMLERALAAGVPFSYFLADEAYGQCRTLRAWLEERQVRSVLAVPTDEVVALPDGHTRQARELYALVPQEALERRSCADGAKGPREYDWAAVHLAPTAQGLERHLLIRRSTVPNKKDKKTGRLIREVAYFLCHTDPGATLAELVVAAGRRWMVEESFQVAKGQVGLDEHEVPKWCSWYRHTTVCMLAMAFLVAVRSRLIPRQSPTPDRERDPPPVRPDRPRSRPHRPDLAGHALAPLAHPPPSPGPGQPLPHPRGPRSLTVKPPAVVLVQQVASPVRVDGGAV